MRVGLTTCLFLMAFAVVGQSFNQYWARSSHRCYVSAWSDSRRRCATCAARRRISSPRFCTVGFCTALRINRFGGDNCCLWKCLCTKELRRFISCLFARLCGVGWCKTPSYDGGWIGVVPGSHALRGNPFSDAPRRIG